ncbi:MAG: ammonium transporter [Myxococcaceae bacterium]|jgi:Amt family ammonium transporter|nr:ammonium transporter [Myxococcaceae bacterium]MCA3015504.1 ammonium transporter [Myxococcaceae bacterium]
MEASVAAPVFDAGSTAWMLTSSALVLLMVPGLALFYGGMVRRKNVLTTMMMSFVAMALIGVQWVLVGYALAFGQSRGGFIGWDPALVALSGIDMNRAYSDKGIPELVFVMFQGKFAIITPALISGAVAERMRFRSYLVFTVVWATLIYCPLAHWVWAADGWLFARGVLDFAGGTVVHIAAGVSALVLALMLGPRRDFKRAAILPNNLVLTLTGAGLLWFGWFGFNAGSAVAVEHPAGATAGLAFTTTQSAAAAAGLSWMLMERWHHGKVTSLGLASGFVAGLVVVTPAAGHVRPLWALVMGAVASVVCYWAVQLKNRFDYDDSLDAFGVHGVGGIVGALLTGVFCFTPVQGLLDGDAAQLGKQALGVAVAIVFAGGGTFLIASVLKATLGLRATEQEERDGQDLHVHGERGYHFDQT